MLELINPSAFVCRQQHGIGKCFFEVAAVTVEPAWLQPKITYDGCRPAGRAL